MGAFDGAVLMRDASIVTGRSVIGLTESIGTRSIYELIATQHHGYTKPKMAFLLTPGFFSRADGFPVRPKAQVPRVVARIYKLMNLLGIFHPEHLQADADIICDEQTVNLRPNDRIIPVDSRPPQWGIKRRKIRDVEFT